MSGPGSEHEAWLRRLQDCIVAEPSMPAGALIMHSGIDQVIRVSNVTRMTARLAVSDLVAEDCRSIFESADYVVRYRDQDPAIICECCGTAVAKMPERLAADRDAPWKPGIWEPVAGRRHTLRRCEWKRVNP